MSVVSKGSWPFHNPPLVPPIVQASVFQFDSIAHVQAVGEGTQQGHVYSRWGHPNAEMVENALASLENGEKALAFASGMAALTAALLSLLHPGDHVVAVGSLYGGTHSLLQEQLSQYGIRVTFTGQEKVEDAVQSNTRVLLGETIGNPKMDVMDIRYLADIAQNHNLFLLIDNTFASPVLCRPLEWGADGVMHSATKYLNGHGDVMGGFLVGRRDWLDGVKAWAVQLGAVLDPFAAWLIQRSLQTLSLRMQAHSRNARQIAEFLVTHPKVERVYYPSIQNPELAAKYLPDGCGGMLSFVVSGDPDRVITGLERIVFAPSLADTATTISHPGSTSHKALGEEGRRALGVPWEMLRLSAGIDDPQASIADLEKGLSRL